MRLCVTAGVLTSLTLFVCELPVTAQVTRTAPLVRPTAPPDAPVLLPSVRPGRMVQPSRVLTEPIATAKLIERLRTANTNDRLDIIRQLSDDQMKNIPALVKALDDPDPLVKSGVAEALGNHTEEAISAIPALVAMVKDIRRAIVPKPFRGVLLDDLPLLLPPSTGETRHEPPTPPQNPESLLRVTAIVAIGKIGLPARASATVPLTGALQDPDPWVRLSATWALAEIGAQVPLLSHWLEALQSPQAELRRSAAETFGDARSLLRKALGAEADANTASQLVATLRDDDPTVRDAAGQALVLLGTGALPALIRALKAPEPIVRFEATRLVGNFEGAAQVTVPDLITLLGDAGQSSPPERKNPFGVLRLRPLRFSSPYDYSPQEPDNPDYLVRANAAIALGKVGDRQAISALTTALNDKNPWMQLATVWALRQLGQPQGLPLVGQLLQHPDTAIQSAALSQLRGYGSQSASYIVPYISSRLSSRLDLKDDDQRNEAIIQAGRFGAAALGLVPKLRTLLTSSQKNSPGYAATVLGDIAESTAVAWRIGDLSDSQRRQAIAEFTKVLAVMETPGARFNRSTVNYVRDALVILKAPEGIYPQRSLLKRPSPRT